MPSSPRSEAKFTGRSSATDLTTAIDDALDPPGRFLGHEEIVRPEECHGNGLSESAHGSTHRKVGIGDCGGRGLCADVGGCRQTKQEREEG